MAGVFPVPVKSSGRKQWTIYNGTRRFGRSQPAEDGCPESQVVLAKQLLDEKADLEIDQEENARLGVYWLIKASEQGHEEATTILRHCLESGQGITEHNYLDVKACLAMSHDEKIARQAAKQLFASMSGGDDFITSDQLDDCMSRSGLGNIVTTNDDNAAATPSSPAPDWKSRRNSGVEKLTEEMLVSAASNYSKGELPLVHRAVLQLETSRYYNRNACSFLLFPVLMLSSCCNRIVDTISRQNFRYIFSVIYTNLQAAIFLWIMTRFDFDTVIGVLPGVVYFASLIVMIIATCQALSKNNDFHHFCRWSNLFLQYSGGNLNAAEAEYQHCCNNLYPYGIFFIALLIHLIFTPIVLPILSPQSEITVIAFVCTFLTLYKYTIISSVITSPVDGNKADGTPNTTSARVSSVDLLALFSFSVHVLARYPYETDSVVSCGWRFLDVHVPTFASYVVGNGVEFCLNFRALFYLLIPAVSIKMASRNNWRGIYTSLVPHCMSLAWWQITILSSQGATWYGLIRSALALVGFVLFLPLAGLATVLVPIVAASKFLFEFDELSPQLISTVVYTSCPVLLAFFINCFRKSSPSKWNVIINCAQILLVVSSICMFVVLTPQFTASTRNEYGRKSMQGISMSDDRSHGPVSFSGISWSQFQRSCSSPIECSELYGLPVRWEGRVAATRLVRIYNPLAELSRRLPRSVWSTIKCWYGEKYTRNNDNVMDGSENIQYQLIDECHLSNWNRYEFEVDVIMTSGIWRSTESLVTLVNLDNSFKNMTTLLKAGDHIWYSGSLVSDSSGIVDRDAARVETDTIGCLICKEEAIANTIVKKEKIFSVISIYSSVKAILNFFFNPVVIFR